MVEPQPSKLMMPVRSRSAALNEPPGGRLAWCAALQFLLDFIRGYRADGVSDRPNYEVAATAVAKLDAQFGAENVTQPQRLAEMRILTNTRPDTVTAAVARASRDWCRRPNLDELGQLLRDELQEVRL